MFDAIADAMVLTENAGHVVFANPATQQLKIEQAGICVQSYENVKTFLNAYPADFSSCIILDVKMSDGVLHARANTRRLHFVSVLPIMKRPTSNVR
jgi:hypothetical protein